MLLLGLVGKKKVGKDEVYKIIKAALLPYEVRRIGFADSLKEEVACATYTTINYINEHKDNFRLILQGWGTDFKRELQSKNYWIIKVANKIKELPDNICYVVFPDVRFLNEAAFIRELGGYIIRIDRPNNPDVLSPDLHPSEYELEKIQQDYTIINNGSLEDLKIITKSLLFNIKEKMKDKNVSTT